MGTRKSRHNKGRSPLYKEKRLHLGYGKAIWDQPGFYEAPDKKEEVRKLLLSGLGLRGTAEKLGMKNSEVRRIACVGGKLLPEYATASNFAASIRSKTMMANGMREHLSGMAKQRWAAKKAFDSIPRALPTVTELLDKGPRYRSFDGSAMWWKRGFWNSIERNRLAVLAAHSINIETAANILGRAPTSLIHKALDLAITLPQGWKEVIPYILHPKNYYKPVEKRLAISYPFIIKPRAEHEELLAINSLVPKGLPDDMRGDVCQELMLEIYQGKLSIEALRGSKGWKIIKDALRKWRNDNWERAGYGVMQIDELDGDKSYDEVASGMAMQDWDYEQMNDRRSAWDSQFYNRVGHACQVEDVYRREIMDEGYKLSRRGEVHRYKDVRAMMDNRT